MLSLADLLLAVDESKSARSKRRRSRFVLLDHRA